MENVSTDDAKARFTDLLGEDLADQVLSAAGVSESPEPKKQPKIGKGVLSEGLIEVAGVDGSRAVLALCHIESIVLVTGDAGVIGLEIHTAGGGEFRTTHSLQGAAALLKAWAKAL